MQKVLGTTFVLILAGTIGFAPALRAADRSTSDSVTKLLIEARDEARALEDDSALLESFTRSGISDSTQGVVANQVKQHVNTVARQLARLQAEREGAELWQKAAIDRIEPLLADVSEDTEMLIDHINRTHGRLNLRDYRDLLETHSGESRELASLISDFVSYGRSKSRNEKLTDKLEIPTAR